MGHNANHMRKRQNTKTPLKTNFMLEVFLSLYQTTRNLPKVKVRKIEDKDRK